MSVPVISTPPPSSLALSEGDDLSLTVVVTASPAATLQWKKNGADLPGETAGTLTISGVRTNDAGSYSVVATNADGSASASSTVTVDSLSYDPPFQPKEMTLGELANVWYAHKRRRDRIRREQLTPGGIVLEDWGDLTAAGSADDFGNLTSATSQEDWQWVTN